MYNLLPIRYCISRIEGKKALVIYLNRSLTFLYGFDFP